MTKKILIIAILALMMFQSAAFALETEGEVIFRDSLYGAAIGFLLGSAVYLAEDKDDRNNYAGKAAIGTAIGIVGGLIFGVVETRSFAEVSRDGVKIAVPTPVIKKTEKGLQYSASLLKAAF